MLSNQVVKAHMLQAAFARRREQEHMRNERTAAVSRYYDHWGKVTTRFGNWTAPEYYEEANEKLKKIKEKKEKAAVLVQRQEKLRQLLQTEHSAYEMEATEASKPRARKVNASNETLAKINDKLKERENIKRKLDLEAKLYGRWRHGVDDENLLFESKTNNEMLAKLNWLDKQIDDQLTREKEQTAAQERNLRLQEQISKTELLQKERQQIREQEIKEIRALQERHMEELKKRQVESDALKSLEQNVRLSMNELEHELELLEESSAALRQPAEFSQAYNLKKIKVFIRKRSDIFRNQIKLSMTMLERMSAYAQRQERIDELLQKYRRELETETLALAQIDAMYESEAKYNLQRCETAWQSKNLDRYQELKQLINDEQFDFAKHLEDNLARQTDIVEIRSTHLNSIENSNEKLKQLIKEHEDSPRGAAGVNTPREQATTSSQGAATRTPANMAAATSHSTSASLAGDSIVATSSSSDASLPAANDSSMPPKVTSSFSNLNLDGWKHLTSVRGGADSPRLLKQRSLQVVTPQLAERPKFARKRVAWT